MSKRIQVCDRCRALKKGCYGSGDSCINCSVANISCETTTRLKRKRKPNSIFQNTPNSSEIEDYKNQIETLKDEIEILKQKNAQKESDDNLIIQHLGRMLPSTKNTNGEPIFAGSSTGVFFINQVQQDVQRFKQKINSNINPGELFSESSYLAYRSSNMDPQNTPQTNIDQVILVLNGLDIKSLIRNFFQKWHPMYPIFDEKYCIAYSSDFDIIELTEKIDFIKNGNDALKQLPTLYCFLMIISIQMATLDYKCSISLFQYLQDNLLIRLMNFSSLETLQCYLITMLYLQVIGDHELCIQFNGKSVRLAFLYGLHRHSQRFKFNKEISEERKNIWWCTYCFDILISCNNGLPRLINDEDVDTDLPLKINGFKPSGDKKEREAILPLPGEESNSSLFISIIKLCRILSLIMKNLYTTTQRRNGDIKMKQLRERLNNWKSEYYEIFECMDNNETHFHGKYYLQLLYYTCMIHLYRPGLTYPKASLSFENCLGESLKISEDFITLFANHSKKFPEINFIYPCGFHLLFQSGLLILWNQILVVIDDCVKYTVGIDDVQKYILICSDCLKLREDDALFKYRSNIANKCGNTIQMLNKYILSYYHTLGTSLLDENEGDKFKNINNLLNDSWNENLELINFFELSPSFLNNSMNYNLDENIY
ncbi:unnamed protein product [Debaryomyces fabryi]|nr:unnamed protein product [Debaryomyces fabryi]